jgi:transposase
MNQVRIDERKEHDALKGHKYTFLRNRDNLTNKQEASLAEMIDLYPTLGQAYRLSSSVTYGQCLISALQKPF